MIIWSQPSSNTTSPLPSTSCSSLTLFTLSSMIRLHLLHIPRQRMAWVDCVESRGHTWERRRWPQLKRRSTSIDVAVENIQSNNTDWNQTETYLEYLNSSGPCERVEGTYHAVHATKQADQWHARHLNSDSGQFLSLGQQLWEEWGWEGCWTCWYPSR